jgi:hypothetical protein
MRRIQEERPKPRKRRVLDPLPIDPRDPDVLRVKSQLYAVRVHRQGPHHA